MRGISGDVCHPFCSLFVHLATLTLIVTLNENDFAGSGVAWDSGFG
jgi:hypothetical protein